jgi:hypothetical protein
MEKRGVLYVYWGGSKQERFLERSVQSLFNHHPELPVQIEKLPDGATLLDKSRMFELSHFDETLFLDIDTVVLGDLTFAFQKATRHGIACAINECPWARRCTGLRADGDIVEYNTGVLFFTRAAERVFTAWRQYAPAVDSSIRHVHQGRVGVDPVGDQASFAKAVDQTGFPLFALPLNWNFRPGWHMSYFGPIRIWHDYSEVPPEILSTNASQDREDAIIQFYSRAPEPED